MDENSEELRQQVAKNTALMTAGTLLSRATGLVRTWFMAFALGAGITASAYQVANNIPNIIYELVAGGLITAAFLPVLVSEQQKGAEHASRYSSNILNLSAVILGALSLAAIFLAEPLVYTQTFTIDSSSAVPSQATALFRIFALQVLFYGVGGVATTILNAQRTYFITALAPALNNIVVIASFAAYAVIATENPAVAIDVLAIGTTAGVAVQAVVQVPALIRGGFKWMPVLSLRDPALKDTVLLALPSIAFVVLSLVSVSARNAFSLVAGDSGPAMVAYAWLWFQLPYGVIAVSLSQTMFTEMSDAAAAGDMGTFTRYVSQSLKTSLLLMLPMCACLFALSDPLMGLFRAGAFTEQDLHTTSLLLKMWALGLPSYTIFMYLYKAFAAMKRMGRFAVMNLVAVIMQVVLYACLSPTQLGILAIPIADIAYYTAAAVASMFLLRKAANRRLGLSSIAKDTGKSLASAIAGCAAMMGMLAVSPEASDPITSIWELVVCGGAGIAICAVLGHAMGIRDFSDLLRSLLGKLKKRSGQEGAT